MSYNVIHGNEILAKFFEFTNVQTHQSLCCLHTQSMDIDEDSDQNIDLALLDTSPGYIPMGV